MNKLKSGNIVKLVAFLVIAGVLTCTVAFAAGGWQSFTDEEPDSGEADADNLPASGEADENKDGTTNEEVEAPVSPPTPKYYHYITGEEIAAEEIYNKAVCFTFASNSPLYGISTSYLTIEMPTENGDTRYLVFTDSAMNLGKIGSISPIRGYMIDVARAFGGVLIYQGSDDAFDYTHSDYASSSVNMAAINGYCYSEYTEFHYSNGDLIRAMFKNCNVSQVRDSSVTVPYILNEIDSDKISGSTKATMLTIDYSDINSSSLVYDSVTEKYVLYKNDAELKDLLNDRNTSYDNAFVLFADSVTYETSNAAESVLQMSNGGTGYYFTSGTVQEITWNMNKNGDLEFLDSNGERLTVNRGSSYISFVKSSKSNTVSYK